MRSFHACAGKTNPRGKEMAVFLVSAWILGKRADVQMDPQLLLSADLVQRIVRYEDLWDVLILGRKDAFTKEFFDEVSKLMDSMASQIACWRLCREGFIWIGQPEGGKPIDPYKWQEP